MALALFLACVPALVMWSVAPPQRRRARAWWLLGTLGASAGWIVPTEPWLTILAILVAYWWYQPTDDRAGQLGGEHLLPIVFGWLGIAATWFLARAIRPQDLWLLTWGWGLLGSGHVVLMVWERWHRAERVRAPAAGLGQRMYAGCFLALLCLVLPLGFWPLLSVGLWLTGPSWLALLALGAGSAVRWPWTMPYTAALLLVAAGALLAGEWRKVDAWPLNLCPRGSSLDGPRMRFLIWRLALASMLRSPGAWLLGFGPGTAPRASRRWNLRIPRVEALGNFHSDPIQAVYEYGAMGLLGLALFGWRVGSGLQWSDPWSAAAVGGLIIAFGTNMASIVPLGVTFLIICGRVAP